MRPISLLYNEYQDFSSGKISSTRKRAESLQTNKVTGKEESLKVKESTRKDRHSFEDLDETEVDDFDRPIASISKQVDAWKSVTTLKVEIGLSHLKSTINLSKTDSLCKGESPPYKPVEMNRFTSVDTSRFF